MKEALKQHWPEYLMEAAEAASPPLGHRVGPVGRFRGTWLAVNRPECPRHARLIIGKRWPTREDLSRKAGFATVYGYLRLGDHASKWIA
jgi:hypothetical protein